MDIHFITDPGQVPVPREEVKVSDLELELYPDKRRIRVSVKITPFRPIDKPNLFIAAHDNNQMVLVSTTIIETINPNLTITLHLPSVHEGALSVICTLYYDDLDHAQHRLEQNIL